LHKYFITGDANQLDLVGSLYVGSVDYMDPYLLLPPAVWSATLRYGFVGCLKDLYINGAPINVVAYAHEQDVGKFNTIFVQCSFKIKLLFKFYV
jgi:leucine-rich repeat transmembrane neuronal protein 1/2